MAHLFLSNLFQSEYSDGYLTPGGALAWNILAWLSAATHLGVQNPTPKPPSGPER